MPKFLVYHNSQKLDFQFTIDNPDAVEDAATFLSPKFLDLVAEVQVDTKSNLEAVWESTNSIHNFWWDNDNVNPLQTDPRRFGRSLCVGDIIFNPITLKGWVVMRFGFTAITDISPEWKAPGYAI